MKRVVILFAIILIFPLISAQIIINQQPGEVYSLGEEISIPATIKPTTDLTGIFQMDLICEGYQINFYKNGVSLSSGEEKRMEPSLVLTKNVIGNLKGTCKVKAFIEEDFVLTNEFQISDSITINVDFESLEFNPGENILIDGNAIKESGGEVNGFIEFSIVEGNASTMSQLETINNGFFSINITFPRDMKAGAHLLKLKAHEEDIGGEITNHGFRDQNIIINQIPTSLEIVFDNPEVKPGTNVIVKAILHDQTGVSIASTVFLTIKNQKDKIFEQTEIATDEFLEFLIAYNELPSTWKVVAVSNKLTSESSFTILEKEAIDIEIINKTITITNMGNVLYNKTALVKIGDKSLNVFVYLEVDESQRYILTAPEGEYKIEFIADGKSTVAEDIPLTGKIIDVKKASRSVGSLVKYPFVWIFIILILGFIGFISFKRGYPKKFVGHITSKTPKKPKKTSPLTKTSLVSSANKAEMSLSIKGDKQNVSVIGLHIRNLKEVQAKKGNVEEILQKIVNIAEEHKGATYESQSTIFFIIAPTKTRTFKNEKTALTIAQKIKKMLEEHNKIAKQKIHFGISLNHGTIVAKQEADSLKFMSMGTLMAHTKKIASLANNDILLGEKINHNLKEEVKTTRHEKGNMHVYSIKEVKDVEGNRAFVRSFLDRIEHKDKEGKKEEK